MRRVESNEFVVSLALHQAMHVAIAAVVPHTARLQLHRICMQGLLVVQPSMFIHIAPAADIATDQTHPQTLGSATHTAFRSLRFRLLTVSAHYKQCLSYVMSAVAVVVVTGTGVAALPFG